ncbi:peptidylprolyl isomerase [Microbacterium sp.]|jgi:peptidyl-prolyl cis-trans isomerase B (cyclophilin B)|uniref:peptidylprolyl isomerase n=1 Tax=Microbacterium sp. TaxID=51671 RepID=UPI0037C848B0
MRSRLLSLSIVALTLTMLAGCAAGTPEAAPTETEGCSYVEAAGGVRDVSAPTADVTGAVGATLQTTEGDVPLTLDADRTPCTVGSFVSLAEQGYYDNSPCHRLTTAGIFVLQCGDPSGTGRGGPGYSYADELDGAETYPAGTVAMANAGEDTNGSQFFLVYEDTELPAAYTVFGKLSPEGLAVVRQIAAAGAEGGAADGAPATPVTITAVSLG